MEAGSPTVPFCGKPSLGDSVVTPAMLEGDGVA
jgi:hypothetical protein